MRALRRIVEAAVITLFAVMVTVFGASIAARYVFDRPIIWADEVLVLTMVWCTFLTGALLLEEREQVVFDLVYERCTERGRRIMLIAGSALLAAILAAALPQIVSYTRFLWRERTNVLLVRLDLAYACFAFFIAAIVVRRLFFIARLLGANWKGELAKIDPAAPAKPEVCP
jgi:TRAP-type C4-dicarboxylate transport system permease small subunit